MNYTQNILKEIGILIVVSISLLACQQRDAVLDFPSDDRALFFDYSALSHLNPSIVQVYSKQTMTANKFVKPGLIFTKAQQDTIKKIIRLTRQKLPDAYIDTVAHTFGFPVWDKGCLLSSGESGSWLYYVPLIRKNGRRMNGFLGLRFENYRLLFSRVCDRDLLEQFKFSDTDEEEAGFSVLLHVLTNALNFKAFETTVFRWEEHYSEQELPGMKNMLARDGFDLSRPMFVFIHVTNACYAMHFFQGKLNGGLSLSCVSYANWQQIVSADGSDAPFLVLPLSDYEMLQ